MKQGLQTWNNEHTSHKFDLEKKVKLGQRALLDLQNEKENLDRAKNTHSLRFLTMRHRQSDLWIRSQKELRHSEDAFLSAVIGRLLRGVCLASWDSWAAARRPAQASYRRGECLAGGTGWHLLLSRNPP